MYEEERTAAIQVGVAALGNTSLIVSAVQLGDSLGDGAGPEHPGIHASVLNSRKIPSPLTIIAGSQSIRLSRASP